MKRTLSSVFLSTLVLVSCAKDDADDGTSGDAATAEQALDSSESSQSEGEVIASLTDGIEADAAAAVIVRPPEIPPREIPIPPPQIVVNGDLVAARVEFRAKNRYLPAGCATVTREGAKVTVVANACSGPRGLRTITGTIVTQASVAENGDFQLAVSADDLKVNGATMDLSGTALFSPSTKTLKVTSTASGTGWLGRAITREGEYEVVRDDGCAQVKGTWSTELGKKERSTVVDLKRCVNACPVGSIVHTGLLGRVITTTLDGTATATWATSDGGSGEKTLACGK